MEYMTAEDKARLQQELSQCITRRKAITQRIADARELGDLSENAEYHAAREDQGMNEARIKLLEHRLATSVVAEAGSIPEDVVFVGMTVRLREVDSGDEELCRLVGETSGRFDMDYIEVTPNSPMGMALIKAKVGDTVRVDSRRGERRYEIVEILDCADA
ncbi:MAG: transcription elongation factor GreA [Phycisphaerales bacterium]|nr:MAG: transcription elongation factor GreA [Phycisphaerales bacterium]